MKKLPVVIFMMASLLITSIVWAPFAAAKEEAFADTATGKAAAELIDGLSNVLNDVTEMKQMTLEQKLAYVRTKGKERIWAKTKEKSWAKVSDLVTNYAQEKMRSDYFKSKVPYMMQKCVMEKKAVSAIWHDVDGEIGSKVTANVNALKTALAGLEVAKGAYDAWSKDGPEKGLRALGTGAADKILEYAIPGWGYYRLAQSLVEALGNYVMSDAFEMAQLAKTEAILPVDPKQSPKAFADWILKTDIPAFVNREWVEQIGYTGAYQKYDGDGQTKDDYGDKMKREIIDSLTAIKDDLLSKKQIEADMGSKIQAADDKTAAAAQAVKTATDESLKEADVYLAKIEAFEQQYYGLRKKDVQKTINNTQQEFEQIKATDAQEQYHYTPIDRAAIVSAFEAAYAEVTETYTQGYDFDKMHDELANYADIREQVLKANNEQFVLLTKKLDDSCAAWNKKFSDFEAQIQATTEEKAHRALVEQKMRMLGESDAELNPMRNALSVMGEERTKDMAMLVAAESIVSLEVEARNRTMVDALDKGLGDLQTEMDEALAKYTQEEASIDGEIAGLANPTPYGDMSHFQIGTQSPAAQRFPEEFFKELARLREVKSKLTFDVQSGPQLFTRKLANIKKYKTACDLGRSKFDLLVPAKYQSITNGLWTVKYPSITFDDRRSRAADANHVAIKILKDRQGIRVKTEVEAFVKQAKDRLETLLYDKAIKSLNELLSQYEALETPAKIARAFSVQLNAVVTDLAPYEKNQLDRINLGTLLTTKDGKADAAIDPNQSDGAKFIQDMKAAYEKNEGALTSLKNMRDAYQKAAGAFRFQYADPLKDYPIFDEYLQIPGRITAFEAALQKAGDRQQWLLENTPKDLEKWRRDLAEQMQSGQTPAAQFQKLKSLEDSLNHRLNEIGPYKAAPAFSKLTDDLNNFGRDLKEAIQKTDAILTGKVSPPDGNPGGSDYRILNARLNTYSLDSAYGDVALTRSQLVRGTLQVTGQLSRMDRIEKLLISEDGGRTWTELTKAQMFSFEITPIVGKRYEILLRLKMDNFQDIDLKCFPTVQAVVFQDINTDQLIVQAVKDLADAYEAKNISRFSDLISQDYLWDKTLLVEGVRFDFDMFNDIRLDIFFNRIEKQKTTYLVEAKWNKAQTPRKTMQEQKTTGKTTMVFTLEDGRMKIQNLRGNLLYATLSVDIAAASGLSQTVIDAIRQAHDDRNPTQPGAGATLDTGGVGGPAIAVRSAELTDANSYDFVQALLVPGVGTNDISSTALIIQFNNSSYQTAAGSFESITTAPTGGYAKVPMIMAAAGTVLILKTDSGYYGKMKITVVKGGILAFDFDYAIQTDGSTNIKT